MIRVFHGIRQKLAAEGRVGRYIAYAVGEMALIVAGILIALQIDAWVEDREDRRFERKTLEQIKRNLETDHAKLSNALANRQAAAQAVDRILAIPDPDDPDADIKHWLADIMQFDRFNSISNAYEVLKSRGLDVIRNDELRSTLGLYYDSWAREIQAHNEDIERGFFDHWIPFIIADIQTFDWAKIADPYSTPDLLKNRVFINTLKVEQDNHEGGAEHLETMIGVNDRLRALIDAELQ